MEFDYAKGGEAFGAYYPPLGEVGKTIKHIDDGQSTVYYVYEPGNGTRYEVLFSKFYDQYDRDQIVMTLVNFRRSMIIPGSMDMYSISYMKEKLGMGEGDCYALIPLVNSYIKEYA